MDNVARERLTALLWELHTASQDAANNPSQDTIRPVQIAFRKMTKELPSFFSERYRNVIEAEHSMMIAGDTVD